MIFGGKVCVLQRIKRLMCLTKNKKTHLTKNKKTHRNITLFTG